jgi:hypothetical protein
MSKLILISLLVLLVVGDKILVVLDNKQLESTHSQFFDILRDSGSHEVEIAYSFGKSNIELKYYDRFRYEHIVVMCTSDKGTVNSMQTHRAKSRQEILFHISMREET